MTFLESKLLDYFRKCDDDRKFAILEIVSICADPAPASAGSVVDLPPASASAPDPARVQTSIERISKYADGNVPHRYSLTVSDLNYVHELIHQGSSEEIEAIGMVFDYGFVMGNRATRRGKVKAL